MFQERNQRCTDRHHLPWGDVHIVDLFGRDTLDLAVLPVAGQNTLIGEPLVGGQLRVRLGDNHVRLVGRGQVLDVVGDLPVDDLAVRGLDEAERVNAGEGRQRTD